jgi:hypothetical protein
MPFQKGQSGNPKGRPPKSRAWTTLLERAGSKSLTGLDGKKVSRKRFLAEAVLSAVTTGKVELAGGGFVVADSFREWAEFVKWIYTHLDGPAKQQVEHSGPDGQDLVIRVVYDDNGHSEAAETPPGSTAD